MLDKTVLSIDEIRKLAMAVKGSAIQSVVIKNQTGHIKIRIDSNQRGKVPNAVTCRSKAHRDITPVDIVNQTPGKVVLVHPEQKQLLAQIGSKIQPDDVLALVQVGGLYLPVFSDIAGIIATVQVTDGQIVEYGDTLFSIRPL